MKVLLGKGEETTAAIVDFPFCTLCVMHSYCKLQVVAQRCGTRGEWFSDNLSTEPNVAVHAPLESEPLVPDRRPGRPDDQIDIKKSALSHPAQSLSYGDVFG
jgi:hypothetical protein